MKALKYIALAVCCFSLVGCEDFLDVNTTKDDPTFVTVDQALPVATFYAAQVCYDHAEYGVYMSQALTTASKSSTGSYPYSQGWEFLGVNRHPQWRRHFYDLGANIDKMIQVARDNNSLNYELIGRTIMLQSTMLTTDIFGDMPRKEAYQATSPRYDSQKEVYDWMFEEADEIIRLYAEYNQPDSEASKKALPIAEKTDRIYGGDMKKWEAYAKALRCRLYLRYLPNWDLSKASQIIAMVDDVFNSGWEEPHYVYPGGKSEQNCPWGPYAPIINSWESRGNRLASSIPTTFFLQAILGAYQNSYFPDRDYALDPRATKIMAVSDKNKGKSMEFLESNIGMDVSKKTTDYPDLFAGGTSNPFTKNDGYIALMLDEELMFIKAEAQYWAGDKAGAYQTTVEAVIRNMDRYGVKHQTRTDEEMIDLNAWEQGRYEVFWRVKLPGAAQFTIADLMQQKYVAMYLQPEQWTDLRRYNYSSATNDLRYDNVFVYTVAKCQDPAATNAVTDLDLFVADFKEDFAYSLRRPYNLYAAYWDQPDCYTDASKAVLSDKAWVNRLNPDTETETKYNKAELIRIGACNAAGQVDYHWMQKKMIWQ